VRSGKAASRKLLALLEHAAAEALSAGDIVHHLREFAQKRGSHLEATNLNGLVRNVARLLEREIVQREITLQLDLAPLPIPVRADRIEIEQVLVNLIQNAIDAVCEGSERKQIYVQTRQTEDAMAEVTVRDIGTGLSDAAAERLFEAFFTTKAQGLGMGLAISRSIIEAHRGRIWVKRPADGGRGTTIRFTLPLLQPPRAVRKKRAT
jgi:two-component system sensor kinase FixL